MPNLTPDEVDRIKEEQRLRTTETVKTGLRMYFGFVGKVLKITCGCILIVLLIGGLIALIISGVGALNQRKYARQFEATRLAQQTQATIAPEPTQRPNIENTEQVIPGDISQSTKTPDPLPSPSSTPTPTITATPSIRIDIYVVQSKQESLICLARRFDIDTRILMALNNLNPTSVLSVGEEILLPTGSTAPFEGERVLKEHPDTYIVTAGDTVYSISCGYGDISPDSIIFENGLTEPYTLTPGQQLIIP